MYKRFSLCYCLWKQSKSSLWLMQRCITAVEWQFQSLRDEKRKIYNKKWSEKTVNDELNNRKCWTPLNTFTIYHQLRHRHHPNHLHQPPPILTNSNCWRPEHFTNKTDDVDAVVQYYCHKQLRFTVFFCLTPCSLLLIAWMLKYASLAVVGRMLKRVINVWKWFEINEKHSYIKLGCKLLQ